MGFDDPGWWKEDGSQIDCRQCASWAECPCKKGCGWGWCMANEEFTRAGDTC